MVKPKIVRLMIFPVMLFSMASSKAQEWPVGGVYQIMSGGFGQWVEVFSNTFDFRLPDTNQSYVELAVDAQRDKVQMAILGEDRHTVFSSFGFALLFTNGWCSPITFNLHGKTPCQKSLIGATPSAIPPAGCGLTVYSRGLRGLCMCLPHSGIRISWQFLCPPFPNQCSAGRVAPAAVPLNSRCSMGNLDKRISSRLQPIWSGGLQSAPMYSLRPFVPIARSLTSRTPRAPTLTAAIIGPSRYLERLKGRLR